MQWPPEQTNIFGRDYTFHVLTPPQEGYPDQPQPDSYSCEIFAHDFATRRQVYLDYISRNPAPSGIKSSYYELARIEAGGMPHEGIFLGSCEFVDARRDCSDFVTHSLLRLLFQYPTKVSSATRQRIEQTVLGFKYWPSEPGIDNLCTVTENHQILYATAGYLAGQLFPDAIFTNSGQSGRQKMAEMRPRIERWLDLRFRIGFSEWLSNVYYDEDLTALLTMIDFCQDPDLRERSRIIIDLLLFDIAVNSWHGVFGSTHGRSYGNQKKWAWNEAITDTAKLLFGRGIFSAKDNMSAPCFAISPVYRLPELLFQIANDQAVELENRQRMGMRAKDAHRWGLHSHQPEDAMALLSFGAYFLPKNAAQTLALFDSFNWWENGFYKPLLGKYRPLTRITRHIPIILPLLLRWAERDICRINLEEVNIYTYRTPDYMLSSAPDYRPGYGGFQQHIWQATLGAGAVCFTTHPPKHEGPPPDYWNGDGTLPRVAQIHNALIAIYHSSTRKGLYITNKLFMTHAWLPKDQFDEVVEDAGWVFARKKAGYLALRTQQPYYWQDVPGEDQQREIIAEGPDNIWICELGAQAEYGSFTAFMACITSACVQYNGRSVYYQSPSQGWLRFGWKGPFLHQGEIIRQRDFPRYDNPYAHAPFGANHIVMRYGNETRQYNWQQGTVSTSLS